MWLGDAMDDMPEEYREYMKARAEDPPPATPDVESMFYQPDPINIICEGCPDCDSLPESRSMPDGIEYWCPVCNTKVTD